MTWKLKEKQTEPNKWTFHAKKLSNIEDIISKFILYNETKEEIENPRKAQDTKIKNNCNIK